MKVYYPFYLRFVVALVIVLWIHMPVEAMANHSTSTQLESLAGSKHSLEDYQGKKAVVHFFATWCHPCQEEMPYIVSFSDRIEQNGVPFIPIHLTKLDSDLSQLQSFLTHYQASFDPWLDRSGDMMNQYHVVGIPTTLFLDENGNVEQRIDGMLPIDQAESFISRIKKEN